MTRTRPAAQRGLSLTEVLIVVVVLLILTSMLLMHQLMSYRLDQSHGAAVQLQQEMRLALSRMIPELREAGNVNGNLDMAWGQRLDFQIDRGYDMPPPCPNDAVCWGTDDAAFPTGWIHYIVDIATFRLVRCTSALQADVFAGYAGCRVLANNVSAPVAGIAFMYTHAQREVAVRLHLSISSNQLPGGSLGTGPSPLITRVRLRN